MSNTTKKSPESDALPAVVARLQEQERLSPMAALIRAQQEKLEAALADTGTQFGRFASAAALELANNPKLEPVIRENPRSVLACLVESASLGLVINRQRGEYWLIPREVGQGRGKPRKKTCTGMVGYKGYLALMRRHPDVLGVRADVVYEGERFEWDRTTGVVKHSFSFGTRRENDAVVGAYAVATLREGPPAVVVLDRDQLDERRRRSEADQFAASQRAKKADWGTTSVWDTDFVAMCRKSAARALGQSGEVPLSDAAANAIDREVQEEVRIAQATEVPAEVADDAVDALEVQLQRRAAADSAGQTDADEATEGLGDGPDDGYYDWLEDEFSKRDTDPLALLQNEFGGLPHERLRDVPLFQLQWLSSQLDGSGD